MEKHKLTPDIIQAAIAGFQQQKLAIDAQIAELRAMLPGVPQPVATPAPTEGKGRKMSAAARKRIGEAQRKRWAKSKGETVTTKVSKPKRKLSAEGKAAIVAALKKRWAAKKAGA
jgi:cell division septum initiation protein DivIVA